MRRLWTPEQIAVLKRGCDACEIWRVIADQVNELPGITVSASGAENKARKLGFKKETKWSWTRAQTLARQAAECPQLAIVTVTHADYEPVPADYELVEDYARANKIPFGSWEDLPRVNEFRERHMLPLFKRVFERKGVRVYA